MCSDFLGADQGLVVRYRLHSLLSEALQSLGVFSQIQLGANEDDWNVGRVMIDLWVPLWRIVSHFFAFVRWVANGLLTLALTLSNDGGLTMEKQMRNTSVWG